LVEKARFILLLGKTKKRKNEKKMKKGKEFSPFLFKKKGALEGAAAERKEREERGRKRERKRRERS